MKKENGKTNNSKTIIRRALIFTFGLIALVGLPSRNLCSLALVSSSPTSSLVMVTTSATAPFAFQGFLDGADCDKIFGWAWDSSQPNVSIDVVIWDGSTALATVHANEFRADLPGNKLHAFNFLTPGSLKNGLAHLIRATISGFPNIELTNSPKSLTCAGDTVPPTISVFSVNPTSVQRGGTFNISYTISDSGGSGLNRAELFRAPDNGGVPGAWASIKTNAHSGSGPVSGSFTDSILSTGVYWYGLHVFDNAGNVRFEPDPPGPIRVTVQQSCTPPSITTQPIDQSITSGQQVTLNVAAAGSGPLSYQWYQGSTGTTSNPISGATSTSFITPALTTTTTYWVRVTNPCGNADSRTATVTVGPPQLPDLTTTATPASSYNAGQTNVQFQVTVNRTGGSLPTSGVYVLDRVFFSNDSTWDASDPLLWESNGSTPDFPVSVLNSTGTKTVTATMNIPSVSSTGTYYIIAFVDPLTSTFPNGFYSETNENNNIAIYPVTVNASTPLPDFTVSGLPSSRTITQGQTTTYAITVTSANGFSGSVSLTALNLPGGIVLSGTGFNPQTVTVPSGGSATSTFNYVSNITVPTASFTVTMQGQGGGLTRSATVTLTVNSGATPDLSVSASPSSRSIPQGQTTTYGITVTSQNGFSGSVSLAALNLPGNIALAGTAFNPQTLNVPSGGSATSTFNYVSNSTVPTGTFTVTMQAQGGGLTHSTTVTLIVNPAPPDAAAFVSETIPDDAPPTASGQRFTKTWTIRNVGATTWTSDYKLRWVGGDNLSNHADVAVVGSVSPGSNYTFSIPMTTPSNPGTYRENWKFVSPSGATINVSTSPIIWVTIRVGANCPPPVITTQPRGGPSSDGSFALGVWASGQSLSYQWYEGSSGDTARLIRGAVSSQFMTPKTQRTTNYWVRITNDCGAAADSNTATVTLGRRIEIVDPACDTETHCDGAYLQRGSSVTLTTKKDLLAAASVSRYGIVADGVTRLLLRIRTDKPVSFSLSPGVGTLTKIDGSERGTSVFVEPVTARGEQEVFAVYQAPATYSGTNQPSVVTIRAQIYSGPVAENIEERIDVYRPPVILVHGVWSDSSTWNRLVDRLRDNHYDVCDTCLADYGDDPAGSFDPFSPGRPIQELASRVDRTLELYRRSGRAISQIDVVAHSLGGLVSRAFASRGSAYRRLDNYLAGDFHKLITFGTPHSGTNIAVWLLGHLDRGPVAGFVLAGHPIGDAIYGFVPFSAALGHLAVGSVPMHTIVGIEPSLSDVEAGLDFLIKSVNPLDSVDAILGGEGKHDTIVEDFSQRGPVLPTATTQVRGVVHADPLGRTIGETASADVHAQVISLLSESNDSRSFSASEPSFMVKEWQPLLARRPAYLPPSPAIDLSTSAALSPTPGTIVHPGDVINIGFAPGGALVSGALFFVGGGILGQEGVGPFSVSYTVPSESAGKIDVSVVTYGGPDVFKANSYLIVAPRSEVALVIVSPTDFRLDRIGYRLQLRVTGQLPDGSKIDLTQGTAGTSYSVYSRTDKVISVGPDGLVEARGVGQDTILVTHSGNTYAMNITVGDSMSPTILSASISGKKLFLSGVGFDDGAKILMDGDQQKTAND